MGITYIDEEVPKSKLTYLDESQEEITKEPDVTKEIGSSVAGLATAGATGYGLYKGGKALTSLWFKPKKEIQPIDTELTQLQSKYPELKGTRTADLPEFLGTKKATISKVGESQIQDFTLRSKQATKVLQQSANEFKTNVLTTDINTVASTLKENFPKFLQSKYTAYDVGLDAIEGILQKENIQFPTNSFKELLDGTAKQLTDIGRIDDANKLNKIELNPEGITFKQAKQIMANTAKESPSLGRMLRDNWGFWLENKVSGEAASSLSELNKNYVPVIEMRNALSRYMDSKTGMFDMKGITNYLQNYLNSELELGHKKVIETLNTIKDLPEQFLKLEKSKTKYQQFGKAKQQTLISRDSRIRQLRQQLDKEIAELDMIRTKSLELLSKKEAIIEKHPFRSGAKSMTKPFAYTALRKSIPGFLGIASTGLDILKYGEDPEQYMYETFGGEGQLSPKKTPERSREIFMQKYLGGGGA